MNNTRATYGKLILRTISSTNMIYSVHDLGELVMAPRPRIFNCIFFQTFFFCEPSAEKMANQLRLQAIRARRSLVRSFIRSFKVDSASIFFVDLYSLRFHHPSPPSSLQIMMFN